MTEIWKDIPGLEGYYQASSLGNIKNLSRLVKRSRGGFQNLREKVLRQFHNRKNGYCTVAISIDGKPKTKYVHRLVILAFKGDSDLVVDHINGIKTDNRIDNLRYCTQRDNVCFSKKTPGVSMNDDRYTKRFRARININGKLNELGSFHTSEEAQQAYLSAKSKLQNQPI